jgi:hypothetical protein
MAPGLALTLAALVLFLCTVSWLSSVFQVPGNWIMLLFALLYGWAEGFQAVRWWVLLSGFLLFLLAELMEWAGGYFGAKTFGSSRWGGAFAILGAIVGGLAGAGFGYGLGAIPGTVLGAFAGALGVELYRQRHAGKALWAGLGAALGRAFGLSAKLGAGAVFLALLHVRVIWSLIPRAP